MNNMGVMITVVALLLNSDYQTLKARGERRKDVRIPTCFNVPSIKFSLCRKQNGETGKLH